MPSGYVAVYSLYISLSLCELREVPVNGQANSLLHVAPKQYMLSAHKLLPNQIAGLPPGGVSAVTDTALQGGPPWGGGTEQENRCSARQLQTRPDRRARRGEGSEVAKTPVTPGAKREGQRPPDSH